MPYSWYRGTLLGCALFAFFGLTAQVVPAPAELEEARRLFRKGDFDNAILSYQKLLQQKRDIVAAYAGLVRVYLKKNNVKLAAETATKALSEADSPDLHVALGELYFRQGKILGARQEWDAVIKGGHEEARAYLGLSRYFTADSMNKSARAMLEKAHGLDSADPEIRQLWMNSRSRAEQIEYLQQYLAGENNEDPLMADWLRHRLEYLKALIKVKHPDCLLRSKPANPEIPLGSLPEPARDSGDSLHVSLNGRDFGHDSIFNFDTGASGIVLGGGLAKKAGVVKLADIPIHGWADKPGRNGYAGIVSSVKIGELEFENCPVLVVDRKSLGLTEGIIGADFFAAFLVDLDFPHKKLRLGDLPNWPNDDNNANDENQLRGLHDRYISPEMQSYTPVYRFSQDLLVPATFGTAAPRLFLVDSGSPTNVAARDIASASGALRGRTLLPLAGINGAIGDVHNTEKTELQFGGIDEPGQQAVVFDLAHQSKILGTEISGVIGFATLRHLDVKIDYRDGLVKFGSESGKGP